MEVAVQQMEREELEHIRRLFNTVFYLVEAERPFSDFPGLLQLQKHNGLPLGCAYSNEKQAKTFLGFIAEELRSQLVKSLQEGAFFSVSFDSSTDQGNIDEEMVQVRVLENNRPVYKFVAVKPLAKADAAGTVAAVVEALETDCELNDWQSKLVGLSADGAAINMGVRSGAAKRLRDQVPHLVAVHCCAHRVELAIKTISTNVEDALLQLYKLYKWPHCWSGLQEVGEMLLVSVLKPAKVTGTRWIGHRDRALKILLKGWKGFVVHTNTVAQGKTVSKDRAHHLDSTLTNLKFVLCPIV